MKIYKEDNLRNFEFWSGAVQRVNYLTDDELDTIEYILEDCYADGIAVANFILIKGVCDMKRWDIVDFQGNSAFICADDGGMWFGYETLEEAEYQLGCMIERDSWIPVNYGWHIVEFE